MIDYYGGESEIEDFFYSEWREKAALIVGYTPEVRYNGVIYNETPNKDKFWARITIVSFTDQQATLSTQALGAYTRRYRDNGRVVVQLFGPKNDVETREQIRKLAMLVQDRFRGTKTIHNIWFRNSRIDGNLPDEDLFSRVNVSCDYERDEIK